jgi:hypothetical protein
MPKQKFIIQYDSDKPLFPINVFEFRVNPEYAEDNLKTLKGMLEILLRSLIFIPIDASISGATAKCKRTLFRYYSVLVVS